MKRQLFHGFLICGSMLLFGAPFSLQNEVHARGFGGFHGGGLGGGGFRGGMGGARMAGAGSLGSMRPMGGMNFPSPSRLSPTRLGGGGGIPGGINRSALTSRLPQLGTEAGRLQSLQSRIGQGNLSGRIPNLANGSRGDLSRLSNLNRGPGSNPFNGNGPLSGKVPSAGQLSQFLGIPSDKGLHHLSGETQSRASQLYDRVKSGDNPFANRIDGETQSKLSRAYDAIKSGDGPGKFIPGETQKPLSRLYDSVKSGNRPFENFIPGETQKPLSRLYDRVRNNGNHPLRPWSPWSIHNNAVIIRRNFNNYFIFTPGWYRRYPAAWYPAAWYYGNPWLWAPWSTLAPWCGYPATPVYYDYGDNVVYQQNSVVVNGDTVGTPEQYAQQASDLASEGATDQDADSKDWMSLGVFAVSQGDGKSANMMMQLAINKAGVIRGNYTNTSNNDTQIIQGKVDKKTLRAAWTIGDHDDIVLDTGIYNLTKEETSVLVHFPKEETEQWLMVRLKGKKDSESGSEKDGN